MPLAAESFLPLVTAARAKDTHAWNKLLKQHERPLYAYISDLVRDPVSALDLVQETFANAVRHIDSLRDDRKFASWLFSIGHQRCLQYWRSQQRDSRLLVEPTEDAAELPEAVELDNPRSLLVRKERQAAFFTFIDELPPSQRSVLLLRILEDFSLQEIAEITGSPLGTVKSRLHHATQRLKASFSSL